eukprot:gb/GFBE01068290.1/.p1 GENE.gb/GFBE01068290.1/~~gb/GFBE01068290.1/.p1  ORF type:complete len:565 (+),score=104.08 gb/GFBE01068290.1/:1-1695(+)
MGNCHHAFGGDEPESRRYETVDEPVVRLERAKSLSSNATLTHARYHHHKAGRLLQDDYEVQEEVLGTGLCGKVLLARSRIDQRRYALKTIRKQAVSSAKLRSLSAEVEIYLTLDHPNIAHLQHVYETDAEINLLLECCEGGEMYDRLHKRGVYTDADAARATCQMLRAIGHLHSRNIVHRDIKLENFLYENDDDDAELKLIDFGFAKLWDPSTLMLASCGSIAYVSPDVVLGRGYTNKCDLWGVGVILWMILTGYPPFHGSERVMMNNIKAGKPDWNHSKRWAPVSPEAIDLIKCLLNKDPEKRPDVAQALRHPWLDRKNQQLQSAKLSRGALRSLSAYSKASRVRRAVLLLLAQELGPEETRELRDAFIAIDKSNEGTICLRDLKEAIRSSSAMSPVRQSAAKDACLGLSSPSTSPARKRSQTQEAASPISPARTLCRANSMTLSELFGILDANGDERIYYSDFLAATMEARLRLREEAVRSTFRRLDADCSGTVGVNDMRAVLGANFEEAEVASFMAEMDCTGGEIGYESFLEVLGNRSASAGTEKDLPGQGPTSNAAFGGC